MDALCIKDLLDRRKSPLLSFEFFPPKDGLGMASLETAAAQLLSAKPDFATVTYGAGGSTRERTLQVCDLLRQMGYGPIMPHLTCVGSTRDELLALADRLHGLGYRNIMTLRGDPPQGETVFQAVTDGLAHASDLVALLKTAHTDFCCGVAGYPERHPEAPSAREDIVHLKQKTDAGADFITTQLFFDNRCYFDFVEACRTAGIRQPILPGLLPAISLKQAQRMTARCKTRLPEELIRQMEEAGSEGDAAEEVGIQWAQKQIEELLGRGAPGIHLYVMNRSKAALTPAIADCFRRFRG
ncbi:MAG TPA: methylenetetrahydrofolate reductase [NAD(P)H] [Verrucomicrobia bacterium]|nr:MAG: methylenetetrahydrofolate reductase [NAD(P)H] [Lentisphaerae bacterium GWF2_57_35]HBA84429.1 methylenetetrahydrofolate reductase [NAD(P)H] [Verrucomicrobiota bacterium]